MKGRGLAEYEVYLPLRYNNGRKIPRHKLNRALALVIERYGYYSLRKNVEGKEPFSRREPFHLLAVHTYDSKANDRWFRGFGRRLEKRLRQRRIYITKKALVTL